MAEQTVNLIPPRKREGGFAAPAVSNLSLHLLPVAAIWEPSRRETSCTQTVPGGFRRSPG